MPEENTNEEQVPIIQGNIPAIDLEDLTIIQPINFQVEETDTIEVDEPEEVEVLDTNNRYVLIPKLADSHKLLREDVDIDYSDGSATDNLT